ncbi:MAG: MFS transporter [Patescibacteria group bacterium]|nr:MFS transporter [Patescibacteria group bacterium]
MSAKELRNTVTMYQWFVLFSEPLFWGPILIVSLQQLAHMPLPDILFMEAAVIIICVLLDIPSGALADLIGKKKMLIMGRILLLASIAGFATMSSPFMAWVSDIIWAVGYSFQSGADVAFIYASLKSRNSHRLFKKIEGRAAGLRFILMAVCSLAVSGLVLIHPRLPIIISVIPMTIPLILATQFQEPTSTETYNAAKQFRLITTGIVSVVKNIKMRWIVGFSAGIAGISKIWFFTYNPYFEKVGIPIAYYGFIFFLLNLVAWFSSYYAYYITNILSEKGVMVYMVGCIAIPILLMGMFPIWPFAYLVLLQNLVRGIVKPYLGDFMNRHVFSEETRTTILSVQSSASNLVSITALYCFSFITQKLNLLPSLIILGIVALSIGSLGMWYYQRIFSPHPR